MAPRDARTQLPAGTQPRQFLDSLALQGGLQRLLSLFGSRGKLDCTKTKGIREYPVGVIHAVIQGTADVFARPQYAAGFQ